MSDPDPFLSLLTSSISTMITTMNWEDLSVKKIIDLLDRKYNSSGDIEMERYVPYIRSEIKRLINSKQMEEEEVVEEEEENEQPTKKSKLNKEKSKEKSKSKSKKEKKEEETENEEEVDTSKRSKFSQPLYLSLELSNVLGITTLGRPLITKYIWKYIKDKHLQDPKDKRNVILDEPLIKVFKCKRINMFAMSKKVSSLVHPIEDQKALSQAWLDQDKYVIDHPVPVELDENGNPKKSIDLKKKKTENSLKYGQIFKLTDALSTLLDVSFLNKSLLFKYVWVYIKKNQLQSKKNSKLINCDDKMRAVFKVESFYNNQLAKKLENCYSKVSADEIDAARFIQEQYYKEHPIDESDDVVKEEEEEKEN